jgi:hypothetical protein
MKNPSILLESDEFIYLEINYLDHEVPFSQAFIYLHKVKKLVEHNMGYALDSARHIVWVFDKTSNHYYSLNFLLKF